MKTRISIIVILPLLFWGMVFAQDTEAVDPGWTPDSPLYFLERFAEAVGTFFTFGDIKKAKRHAVLAAERFAETQAIAEKGEAKLIEKTLKRYENHLIKAQLRIEKAQEKGQNTEEVVNIVEEATQKHLVVLEEVLEKVPEEAKPAIRHAMMVSTQEGREMMAEVSEDTSDEGRLKSLCTEKGTPQEICDKIPSDGFESFEGLHAFCVEAGGPQDLCPTIETKCKEFGVTTPNECFRLLSSTQVKAVPAPELQSIQTHEHLQNNCMAAGGSPEDCEKIPQGGFDSFEAIEAFCIETGGPPEGCALLKDKCLDAGITIPDQCYLFLATSALEAFSSTELQTSPPSPPSVEPQPTKIEKELKQRYTPGVSKVIIYSLPTCPHCINAKAWLNQHGIDYEDIDISESQAAQEQFRVRTGSAGVPTLVMDGEVLVGFTEESYSEFFGME
jgi:glutaredoxin